MKVLLPHDIAVRLATELQRSGAQEIGGLLMGEHVQDETFRIVDISVQRHGGTSACFVRAPKDHAGALQAFFEKTRREYTRFNYLGEWHSHPSFHATPSGQDVRAMQEIAEDVTVGVNFLVLLVVRLARGNRFEASATAFRAGAAPMAVDITAEPEEAPATPPSPSNQMPRGKSSGASSWFMTLLGLLPRGSRRVKKREDTQ